jgi:probable rRNA maturation factor
MSARALVSADADAAEEVPAVQTEAEALLAVLATDLPPDAELSVHLVRDEPMRELNLTWRQQDRPTDVLSFPQEGDAPDEVALLGDVVINLDAVQRQAHDHDLESHEEIRFLLIHGVLHLLGHTHGEDEDRSRMEAREQQLWEALGGKGLIR